MSCPSSNDLCRLCQLHPGAYNVYVPDPIHTSMSPASRITWVTQLQLIDGDGLPNEICRQCWIQLNAAYSFIEQCLATDKALRSHMQSTPMKHESMLEVSIEEEDEMGFSETYNSANEQMRKSSFTESDATVIKQEIDDMSYASTMTHSDYVCAICDGSFKGKRAYIVHMQLHAADPDPMFARPKEASAPPQPFKCEMCPRTFTWGSHLKRHVRKHTGDSPYKCTECDKAFYRQDHLTKHFRSHTGERPFQCTLCCRAFTRRDHLASHIKIHVQARPFGCALCPKSFFKQSGLMKHLKNHPPPENSFQLP